MNKMKIRLDRENCIGCGICTTICPKFFSMGEDGKSTLKKGVLNKNLAFSKNFVSSPVLENKKDGSEELEILSIECAQDAADSCPVQVIHVIA